MKHQTIEESVKEFRQLKALSFKDGSIKTNIKKCEDWLHTALTQREAIGERKAEERIRRELLDYSHESHNKDINIWFLCEKLKRENSTDTFAVEYLAEPPEALTPQDISNKK